MTARKPVDAWIDHFATSCCRLDVGSISVQVIQSASTLRWGPFAMVDRRLVSLDKLRYVDIYDAKIACEDYARAELAKMAAVLGTSGPALRSESLGQSGDFATYCDGCDQERDEQHSWQECAERPHAERLAGIDLDVDAQMRIAGLEAAVVALGGEVEAHADHPSLLALYDAAEAWADTAPDADQGAKVEKALLDAVDGAAERRLISRGFYRDDAGNWVAPEAA